jgi:CRISPR-associated exonuclease Cas4
MVEAGISGIQVHYYSVCQRKLWLFSKGITMEQANDRVMEGKMLHERAYPQLEQKEILIDDIFKIDAFDGEYVREVKISSKMGEADRMQMLYYLYQLKQRGIEKKGLISYTKERDTEVVELTEAGETKVIEALIDIKRILQRPRPPGLKKLRYCSKCAYYEFCFAMERDEEC